MGVIPGKQLLLPLSLREEEEDDRRAKHDRDNAGQVRPLITRQEGRFRRGRYLPGVLRVLLADGLRSRERLLQLVLHAGADLLAVRRRGDGLREGRGIAGGEHGAED